MDVESASCDGVQRRTHPRQQGHPRQQPTRLIITATYAVMVQRPRSAPVAAAKPGWPLAPSRPARSAAPQFVSWTRQLREDGRRRFAGEGRALVDRAGRSARECCWTGARGRGASSVQQHCGIRSIGCKTSSSQALAVQRRWQLVHLLAQERVCSSCGEPAPATALCSVQRARHRWWSWVQQGMLVARARLTDTVPPRAEHRLSRSNAQQHARCAEAALSQSVSSVRAQVRPLNERERTEGHRTCVSFDEPTKQVVLTVRRNAAARTLAAAPACARIEGAFGGHRALQALVPTTTSSSDTAVARTVGLLQAVDKNTLLQLRGAAAKGYAFDRRYAQQATSDDIYDDCIASLVEGCFKVRSTSRHAQRQQQQSGGWGAAAWHLGPPWHTHAIVQGYNATVLAYGQTGSGKTHTMSGGVGIHGKAEEGERAAACSLGRSAARPSCSKAQAAYSARAGA